MRTPIAVSPTLFALLLLSSSGIATAVSTTVAWSMRDAAAPTTSSAPPTTAVDPLLPVLQAAVMAELALGEPDGMEPELVARMTGLYRFYADEGARMEALGTRTWARERLASSEQLDADLEEMYALEREALLLEAKQAAAANP